MLVLQMSVNEADLLGGFSPALVTVVNDELAMILHGPLAHGQKMGEGLSVVFQGTLCIGCSSAMKDQVEKDFILVLSSSDGSLESHDLAIGSDQVFIRFGGLLVGNQRLMVEFWESVVAFFQEPPVTVDYLFGAVVLRVERGHQDGPIVLGL